MTSVAPAAVLAACTRGLSCTPTVYGGLVFVETCHSHPEQYDVLAEGGHEVGYVRYRGGWFQVHGPDWFDEVLDAPLLEVERDSAGEGWPGNRIDDDKRATWLTEAAELIHEAMRKRWLA